MGPPKETKTSGRERQFTPDAMCVCVPQPYASLIVSGFYRCIPTRSAELKGYRGTLWIASKEKHSRTDLLTELKSIEVFCDRDVNVANKAKLLNHANRSCLLGSVEVDEGALNPVEEFKGYCLAEYEKCNRFAIRFRDAKRLVLPLPMDMSGAKSAIIVLRKKMLDSARMQSPTPSPPVMQPLESLSSRFDSTISEQPNSDESKISPSRPRQPAESFYERNAYSLCEESSVPQDSVTIVWFRQDLRIQDNPALYNAAKTGSRLVFVYIHPKDSEEGGWPMGEAARVWTKHALMNLSRSLFSLYNSPLLMANAASFENGTAGALQRLVSSVGAGAIFYNRVYEPWKCAQDKEIQRYFECFGVKMVSFKGVVIYEPWEARCDEKDAAMRLGFGSVGFFLRACQNIEIDSIPLREPMHANGYQFRKGNVPQYFCFDADDLNLYSLPKRHACEKDKRWGRKSCKFCAVKYGIVSDSLCPHGRSGPIDWTINMTEFWDMSEHGGQRALAEFMDNGITEFETREKHRGDKKGTSLLSPYVRFGQLSARQILYEVKAKYGNAASRSYLRKFAWRDLSYWFLWRFPNVCDVSFRPHYEKQSWTYDEKLLRKWQEGKTGFPLVDAAMRQLWCVGYMPNYLRHVVAGFLIEYLNMDWKHGFKWFHDTLVDADVAIQAYMWQNGGGCGTDSWNFVMHPVNAAKATDPEGDYVRKWVPELRHLPAGLIHCPWEADLGTLCAANVRLGGTYTRRVVKDLERAHRKNFNAVMNIRDGIGNKYILPSGHEGIVLDNGKVAVCITRVDYREKEICTFQTPEEKWDKRKRLANGDIRGHVLRQEIMNHEKRC
jgi:deoxyribodipyrimidine photolyase